MIARARDALAQRAARTALAARRPSPLSPLGERRLLAVVPGDRETLAAVQDLLDGLALRPDRVDLVHFGEHVADAPDALLGRIREFGPDALDWRRLPTAAVRRQVWEPAPDVALSLVEPGDLAAALLVGASPAAVRIGRHDDDREAFFDLLIGGETDAASAAKALGRLLRQLDPPVLPLR